MVATATAAVGVIAFVGLVVPHMIRILRGPSHTFLLTGSALLGAVLLGAIDIIARVIIPPAELPIGIITAVVGAPVFLIVLLRDQRRGLPGIYG
jgi:iron complex transport system permease protein